MIYLDNAATTHIAPEVLEEMMPYLNEEYGNAGTVYSLGRRAADAISKARKQVADFIGAQPEQIIFTSSGTEANNLAILGSREYLANIGKTHIVSSPIEHDSVLNAINAACKPLSCNNKKCIKDEFYPLYLQVSKYGHISLYELVHLKLHNENIGLVSVMYANNEIGTLNPVTAIGEFCRKNCILFLTDCVQAAGSVPLDVTKIGCDFMSISSHKIHGPKGVGALYVKDKKYISPIINGGRNQEFGIRGGTENVASIVGFGKACELASNDRCYMDKIISNKKKFISVLQNKLRCYSSNIGMRINGLEPGHPGKILSITLDNIDAETLVLMMDARGVCISAGAACTNHESNPSHVLKAIGMSDAEARSTIRISFSRFNTNTDIETAATTLAECVGTLRSFNI